ncbi:MAG: Rid family detoxifying hydrolase [Synergistales bacterium]
MHRVVSTDKAPAAVGAYSQGVWAGPFLYLSGQIALDPASGKMVGDGDPAAETVQVMKNIRGVLESQGMTLDNIVKAVIYAASIKDFKAINDVYKACFPNGYFPARCFVEVGGMALDAKVEIDVTAMPEKA